MPGRVFPAVEEPVLEPFQECIPLCYFFLTMVSNGNFQTYFHSRENTIMNPIPRLSGSQPVVFHLISGHYSSPVNFKANPGRHVISVINVLECISRMYF